MLPLAGARDPFRLAAGDFACRLSSARVKRKNCNDLQKIVSGTTRHDTIPAERWEFANDDDRSQTGLVDRVSHAAIRERYDHRDGGLRMMAVPFPFARPEPYQPKPLTMRETTYRLCLSEDGLGPAHTIEFDAVLPDRALSLLERDRRGRTAVLWQGDRCLCRIRRSCDPHPVWVISPCPIAGSGPIGR